ncbi:MAG: hypothetical protein ISR77_36415 [Pirellulaceae bacterium]|nr:hypothetical protein [Pirellulaceae bacterium]
MRRRRRKGLDWLRLNALSNFRLAPILVRIVVSFFIPVTKPKATAKKGSTKDAVKALKGVVDQQGMEKTRELLDIMEALG